MCIQINIACFHSIILYLHLQIHSAAGRAVHIHKYIYVCMYIYKQLLLYICTSTAAAKRNFRFKRMNTVNSYLMYLSQIDIHMYIQVAAAGSLRVETTNSKRNYISKAIQLLAKVLYHQERIYSHAIQLILILMNRNCVKLQSL